MRKRVLMFTLTSMLMLLCILTSAQEIVVGHIGDADSIFFNSAHYDGLGITSLDDIVGKLPGAERQDDGSITVNGKQWFPEHEYVDLGLSVKWATCNVGASKPDENGEYFAWGETNSKEEYDWPSYKHCAGRSWDSMIKKDCPEYANYLFLTEEHVIGQKVQRFIGSSVRPVCP